MGEESDDYFRLVDETDSARFAQWKHVVIVHGHSAPDGPVMTRFALRFFDTLREHPEGVVMIMVVEATATPTGPARDRLLQFFRDPRLVHLTLVLVLRSDGFAAAAQRSVVTAATMVARHRARLHTTSSLENAFDWLARKCDLVDADIVPQLQASALAFVEDTERAAPAEASKSLEMRTPEGASADADDELQDLPVRS